MATKVVSLQFHKAEQTTSRSSVSEPTKEVVEPNNVEGRVRSINRVFSRMTSTPPATSNLPTQMPVDKSSEGHLTPKPKSMSRGISKVFSIASEDGFVITSTRKVEEHKNVIEVIRLQSEEGVVITSTREVDKPQVDDAPANDNSTLSTILSHEDSKECDALHQTQLQKDALLLAHVKQTVQSTLANDEIRNASMLDTVIVADAKKTFGTSKESDKKDVETSIFSRLSGVVGACSMRLCFESGEPKNNREGEQIIIPQGYGDPDLDDDMSSLTGMSRFE